MSEIKNTAAALADIENAEKASMIMELLQNGATAKDIKGLSDQQMESIYALGVNFYKLGRIAEAEKIFKFLVFFDYYCQKYWIGMGAVHQIQKHFDQARAAYEYAALLDITQPKPIYHAAECYLALGRIEDAEATLDALIEECPPENDLNKKYLEKGEKLRQLIEKVKAAKK